MKRRLTKSRSNRVIDGILGGVGEYFNIDPVILRILYVVFTVFTVFWGGVFFYLLAMIIIPRDVGHLRVDKEDSASSEESPRETVVEEEHTFQEKGSDSSRNFGLLIGVVLIASGGVFLLNNIFDYNLMHYVMKFREYFWGIALIVLGLFLIVFGGRRR